MYNGVKVMIEKELALTPAEKDVQAGSSLKTVA